MTDPNVHESIEKSRGKSYRMGLAGACVNQFATAGGSEYWETFLNFNLSIGRPRARSYNGSSSRSSSMAVSRLVSAACIAAIIFLTGCDPEQTVSSPAGKLSQATAPSLSRPSVPMQAAFAERSEGLSQTAGAKDPSSPP